MTAQLSPGRSQETPPLILVVDDEPRMIKFIRMNLELEGYRVIDASNGLEALEKVRDQIPDLVILDVMMPELDGFETLRLLREITTVPIIMLTVKAEEEDKVRGLSLGADDYVTKPFSPRELTSRVQAVLRRAAMPTPVPKTELVIDDWLTIDFARRRVIVNGEPVELSPTEYRLLYHLVNNAGWVMPYETLLAKVWGYEYRDETHYLRIYVGYLRKKIERDPANPAYILTERGVGYRFADYQKLQDSQPSEKPVGSDQR
jgi:two-component system KDP operon response regulator KdpE